jgi:thiamine-phosphate pyrophosphorylase
MDQSPAVDRAERDARQSAARRGESTPTLADWLTVLLDDEDGRPASLLQKLSVSLDAAREFASNHLPHQHLAPDTDRILRRGRELSVVLRADPTLTTDFVFLAVLEAAETVDGGLAALGASLGQLADLFGEIPSVEPVQPTIDFRVERDEEKLATERLLDAALNRARESFRVLDDYARFVKNDRVFTTELKQLRHRLVAATESLPGVNLLAARDTPGDVGTTITAGREYVRTSPHETARINCKRLQETLRSIEEFGKSYGERFAREIESIRYAVYSLESSLFAERDLRGRLTASSLYVLLTASQCRASLDWTIREAAAGGVQVFQLREKTISDTDLLARARLVRRITRDTGTLFIINDRPDLAVLADADGVHLGQDDLPVASARKIVGPDRLIGVSTHSIGQIHDAVLAGADYLGVGPVFPSTTKTFESLAGLEFVRAAAEATSLPRFALGGITPANVYEVVAAGLRRIAVSAAVTTADDPRQIAARFRESLDACPTLP